MKFILDFSNIPLNGETVIYFPDSPSLPFITLSPEMPEMSCLPHLCPILTLMLGWPLWPLYGPFHKFIKRSLASLCLSDQSLNYIGIIFIHNNFYTTPFCQIKEKLSHLFLRNLRIRKTSQESHHSPVSYQNPAPEP